MDGLTEKVKSLLDEIQTSIYNKAFNHRKDFTTEVNSFDEFETVLKEKGWFISAHWDVTTETEDKIKEKTKATIRVIPVDAKPESGKCVLTGKPSERRVIFAVAY